MQQEGILFSGNVTSLKFSKEIYEKEALIAAAYTRTDAYIVQINDCGPEFEVVFLQKEKSTMFDTETVRKDMLLFGNDVIDEQLRLQLARKTGHLREIIVEHAFKPIDNLKGKIS